MRVTRTDLEKAKEKRDVELLLRLVQTNAEMDQEAQEYLVEILRALINRKIKRPAHRPAKSETEQRRYSVATRALTIEENAHRKKMSQSVAETAREFGVSPSFVYGCLKKYRNEIEEAWRYLEEREEYANFEPDWDDWVPDPEMTDEEIEEAGKQYVERMIDIVRGK